MFSRSVLIGLRWTFFQDLIMSRDLINKKDGLFSVKKKIKIRNRWWIVIFLRRAILSVNYRMSFVNLESLAIIGKVIN